MTIAYYNRGTAHQVKQDMAAAMKDYSLALEVAPEFTDAYINRGQARQAQQDLDGGIADYSKAVELKPDAGVYCALGTVRQAKKDLEGALADYSKAISLDPNLPQAYSGRAVIETLQGKKEEEIQDFEKSFKLEPSLRRPSKSFLRNGWDVLLSR
ncbi:MAG TPA: tetratricopeptide repeat protein [Pyrinomonadaceae bacterium]|nr:tetratricopeptide repeat protein [Pyrinomonadaceae bacterium]